MQPPTRQFSHRRNWMSFLRILATTGTPEAPVLDLVTLASGAVDTVATHGLFDEVSFSPDGSLAVLTYAAAVGSVMVSYVKARAEALQFDCNVGILTRMERYLVLAPALLLNVPLVGMGVIAVLGVFTALQRIWHVRVQARRR